MPAERRTFSYTLYGLNLSSAAPLRALGPPLQDAAGPVDVTIAVAFGRPVQNPRARVVPLGPARDAARGRLAIDDEGYHFIFEGRAGMAVFDVDARGRNIVAHADPEPLLHDTLALLAHPVMVHVARLHGRMCLHANVLARDGGGVALVGRSGVGKSTLSGALWAAGCEVFAEDVAALFERDAVFYAWRGTDRLRVSLRTAAWLAPPHGRLNPVFEDSAGEPHHKVYLDGGQAGDGGAGSLPLRSIYLLTQRNPHLGEAVIRDLRPSDALPLLALNTSGGEVRGGTASPGEFELLARLARTVPVKSLECPDSFDHLERTCARVLADMSFSATTR